MLPLTRGGGVATELVDCNTEGVSVRSDWTSSIFIVESDNPIVAFFLPFAQHLFGSDCVWVSSARRVWPPEDAVLPAAVWWGAHVQPGCFSASNMDKNNHASKWTVDLMHFYIKCKWSVDIMPWEVTLPLASQCPSSYNCSWPHSYKD